jgi:hypothetical protein
MLSDLAILVCTIMCGIAIAFGLFYAMANLHGAAFVFAVVLFAIALVAAIDAALEIVSIVVPDMVRTIKARLRRRRNGK